MARWPVQRPLLLLLLLVVVVVQVQALLAAASAEAEADAGRKLRILSLMTVDTVSHHKFMSPLIVRLAELGHHVHSVDIMQPERIPPTLNVTVLENAFKVLERMGNLRKEMKTQWLRGINVMMNYSVSECADDFNTEALKHLVDPNFNQTFDVIVMDYIGSDCLLGFVHRFNYPPIVALSPFPFPYWIDTLLGNPPMPAISPPFFLPYKHPMTLLQRLISTVIAFLSQAHTYLFIRPSMNAILREQFGPDVPTVEELRQHVAVALVNEVPVLQSPRPLPQSIVPVGGMHLQPANLSNIPKDMRTWLDEAKDGFIVVSFGSIVSSSYFDEDKIKTFFEAFGGIKERVLWKHDGENMTQQLVPPNVRVQKWLPQNDILGHPNLRMFLSHCGGLSTTEFTYHAVPVLGVPFQVDQFMNAQNMQDSGVGRKLLLEDADKDRIIAEIREIIDNPKYRESAARQSRLLRDQKESPLERAVWWVEYVARHRGAPHLRSPALELPLYQVMLLDVFAVLALGVTAALFLTYLCIRVLLRRLLACRKTQRIKQD